MTACEQMTAAYERGRMSRDAEVAQLVAALNRTGRWLRTFSEPMQSSPAEQELVADAHAMATYIETVIKDAEGR